MPVPRAVVLLSGGLDSSTTLALALAEGRECFALTIRYGQTHARETEAAARVADDLGAAGHVCLDVDLAAFGGSALLGDGEIPRGREAGEIAEGIPPTYVPARNTVFLSLALAWAETLDADEIWIGANVVDYSGYPDCRPEFLRAFEETARQGTCRGVEGDRPVRVRAPLLEMSKSEIVKRAVERGVDLSHTWSCYAPTAAGRPCAECDSCLIRARGFREAGLEDPLIA